MAEGFDPLVIKVYTEAVYNHLHYYANWLPGEPVELGDYGVMDGLAFVRQGNVRDPGIDIDIGEVIESHTGDQHSFSSGADTVITMRAKASSAANPAVSINAGVDISFASAYSAFFNAADCTTMSVQNQTKLGHMILAAYNNTNEGWEKDWVVVTELVKSRLTTIAVNGKGAGKLSLQADGDVPQINLAKAEIGLTIESHSNLGYQNVFTNVIVPMVRLSKVQFKFLKMGNRVEPLFASLDATSDGTEASPTTNENASSQLASIDDTSDGAEAAHENPNAEPVSTSPTVVATAEVAEPAVAGEPTPSDPTSAS